MDVNLGLDQDLINAVKGIVESSCASKKMEKEELHPNQKVLDKNNNGKLDADDFKKLRKEEAVDEEVEELDELSKDTLGSYVKKAADDSRDKALDTGIEMQNKDTVRSGIQKFNKSANRVKGISKAVDKLTKEQVEEIEDLAAKHGLGE